MRLVTTICFLIAGNINMLPLIGVVSADRLESLYGMPFTANDLEILMRHRAVLSPSRTGSQT